MASLSHIPTLTHARAGGLANARRNRHRPTDNAKNTVINHINTLIHEGMHIFTHINHCGHLCLTEDMEREIDTALVPRIFGGTAERALLNSL